MQPFVFNTTARIVCAGGSAAELGRHAGALLGSKVLFVTDQGLRAIGLEKPAIASMEAVGAEITVSDAVEADPSLATLQAAAEAASNCNATGIVGFGGGSSMDVAKLTALLAGSGEEID